MAISRIAVVTGATGFIGSRVVRRLLQAGLMVRALSGGSSRHRLIDVADRVCWYGLAESDIHKAACDATHFFHFAVAYDRPGVSDESLHECNVALPLRVIDALPDRPDDPCRCVLGDTFFRKFPVPATAQPRYTASKLLLARTLADRPLRPGLRVALLQIEQVYGPGDSLDKVLPRVTAQLLQPVARVALTSAQQRRDLVHVDDVVEAALVLVCSDWQGLATVPCGSGQAVPMRAVFERLKQVTGSPSELGFGDRPADNDIESSVADLAWLRGLGWQPSVELDDGLHALADDVRVRLQSAALTG